MPDRAGCGDMAFAIWHFNCEIFIPVWDGRPKCRHFHEKGWLVLKSSVSFFGWSLCFRARWEMPSPGAARWVVREGGWERWSLVSVEPSWIGEWQRFPGLC